MNKIIILAIALFINISVEAQILRFKADTLKATQGIHIKGVNRTTFFDNLNSSNQTTTSSIGDSTITRPKLSPTVNVLLDNPGAGINYSPDDVNLEFKVSGIDTTVTINRSLWINSANYTSFSAACDTAYNHGWGVMVSSTQTVTASKSIYCPVSVTSNGRIQQTTGTVTFFSNLSAGRYQIFSGTSSIAFRGPTDYAYPEWWGAIPGDLIEDSDAINSALATGHNVLFSNGNYYVDSLRLARDSQIMEGTWRPRNYNTVAGGTVFLPARNNSRMVYIPYNSGLGQTIRNISFKGIATTDTAKYGIYIDDATSDVTIEYCYFYQFKKADTSYATYNNSSFNALYINLWFWFCDYMIYQTTGTQVSMIRDCTFWSPHICAIYHGAGGSCSIRDSQVEEGTPGGATYLPSRYKLYSFIDLRSPENFTIDNVYFEHGNMAKVFTDTLNFAEIKISNTIGGRTTGTIRGVHFGGSTSGGDTTAHEKYAIDIDNCLGVTSLVIDNCDSYEIRRSILSDAAYTKENIYFEIRNFTWRSMEQATSNIPFLSNIKQRNFLGAFGDQTYLEGARRYGESLILQDNAYTEPKRAKLTIAYNNIGNLLSGVLNRRYLSLDGTDTLFVLNSVDNGVFDFGDSSFTLIVWTISNNKYSFTLLDQLVMSTLSRGYPYLWWGHTWTASAQLPVIGWRSRYRDSDGPEVYSYLGYRLNRDVLGALGPSDFIFNYTGYESNKWTMSTLLRDADTDSMYWYCNGSNLAALVAIPDTFGFSTANDKWFGKLLKGGIDNIAVYNTKLSESELDSIWNNGVMPDLEVYPSGKVSNLVEWWDFENVHQAVSQWDTTFGKILNTRMYLGGYHKRDTGLPEHSYYNALAVVGNDSKIPNLFIGRDGEIESRAQAKFDSLRVPTVKPGNPYQGQIYFIKDSLFIYNSDSTKWFGAKLTP